MGGVVDVLTESMGKVDSGQLNTDGPINALLFSNNIQGRTD